MIGRILCLLGLHDFGPWAEYVQRSFGAWDFASGRICKRCLRVQIREGDYYYMQDKR